MICHYCGYTRTPVEVCPECGSLDVGYSGFGTEMVEEDVRRRFPDLRIVRVDTDAMRKRGQLKETLAKFRDGEIDILLGTQMVAKGLNFPGVKLVGIVLADTGLHLPDFRAQERTFALIVQVSGRAGRYLPDGRLDRRFGARGSVSTAIESSARAQAVAIQGLLRSLPAGQDWPTRLDSLFVAHPHIRPLDLGFPTGWRSRPVWL